MGQVTDQGYLKTSLTEYLALLRAAWSAAAGQDLNFDPDTPQAQITGTEALTFAEVEEAIADLASSLDIFQAQGKQLDDLCSILSIPRRGEIFSNVNADLTGVPLAVVPIGSQAKLDTGELFELVDAVQLDQVGQGSGFFRATEGGAIAVPIGSLNTIATPAAGWETINNPAAGATGQPAESDFVYRSRYFATLAKNAITPVESIIANVFTQPDVTDVTAVENDTTAPAVIEGVTVAAHSIAVAIIGGADADVAEAIRAKKTLGCGTVGDTTVSVPIYLPGTNQIIQNLDISFYRVAPVPSQVSLTIEVGPAFPSDGEAKIKRDLLAYFNGTDLFTSDFELDGLQIAEDVYASRLYTPVNRTPGHVIHSLNLLRVTYPLYNAGTSYNIDEKVEDGLGDPYISLQNGNIGNDPSSSPAFWQPLTSEDVLVINLNEKASLTEDDIYINTI